MTETLDILWSTFDTPMPRFTPEAESAWPLGTSYTLASLGFLTSTDNASEVVCPACEDRHVEEVITRPDAGGVARHYIYCPEALRVQIPNAQVWQRTWDFTRIAETLAGSLALVGNNKMLVPERLWRLGKLTEDTSREVMLARGFTWNDAIKIARQIDGRAIVLVAQHPDRVELWSGHTPALIPLARVTSIQSHRLVLDATHLWSLVREADVAAQATQVLPLDKDDKKLIVRQQLKAELKSFLGDEALVAAYRQHGSFRKAAEALSAQLGTPISKDKIQRAVQRAGGMSAVSTEEDSDSVSRTVASQRRDRSEKFLTRR